MFTLANCSVDCCDKMIVNIPERTSFSGEWTKTASSKAMVFYSRWLLISLYAHMELNRHFDLLKAFGYIERVIKLDFFFEKRPCFRDNIDIVSALFTSYVK